MVIIVMFDFVERGAAIGCHTPQDVHIGERMEGVIDRLLGDFPS